MPISQDFTSILTKDWEINFLQCYPNMRLKYTELCNILQLTAAKHAEMGGISFSNMQAFHQAWVLSRMRVEIVRMPKWKEKVTVKTWIQSLENSRSIRCLELYVGTEKVVGCETFWAVLNTQTRRPEALALPHEHFEKYPNNRATIKSFEKIDIEHSKVQVGERKVQLSDLDIVNHANNVKYLEWCLDDVDSTLLMSGKLKAFEMNFLKEVSLHDAIAIEKSDSSNPQVYSVTKDNKICFALELDF